MKLVSWIIFVAAILTAGCAQNMQPPPPSLGMTRIPSPPPVQRQTLQEGSLYTSDRGASLISDFRARYVGDVITIVIAENLKGSKDVNTQTQRQSEMNVGLSGILGLDFRKRMEPKYNATIDATKAIGGSTTDKFQGTGKTSRNASLTGTISARIVEVLPGGNLMIQGTRALRINNETQYLTLSGVVRPQDIAPDNTVSSTKIADAKIEYTGGGVLSEKQSPAWFARLLGLIALF